MLGRIPRKPRRDAEAPERSAEATTGMRSGKAGLLGRAQPAGDGRMERTCAESSVARVWAGGRLKFARTGPPGARWSPTHIDEDPAATGMTAPGLPWARSEPRWWESAWIRRPRPVFGSKTGAGRVGTRLRVVRRPLRRLSRVRPQSAQVLLGDLRGAQPPGSSKACPPQAPEQQGGPRRSPGSQPGPACPKARGASRDG